jgi:hypothetical protein
MARTLAAWYQPYDGESGFTTGPIPVWDAEGWTYSAFTNNAGHYSITPQVSIASGDLTGTFSRSQTIPESSWSALASMTSVSVPIVSAGPQFVRFMRFVSSLTTGISVGVNKYTVG